MRELDRLYNERYEYLLECSYNSLKLIRRTDLDETLLTDAYVYVIDNEEKIKLKNNIEGDIPQKLLESIVVNWIHKSCVWSNTKFKRKWVYKDKIDINYSVSIEDNKLEDVDSNNKSILNYINNIENDEENMLENELDHINKLNFLSVYIKSLPLHKRILFDMIFKDGINTSGKLSKHIKMSRTNCWKLIKDFKLSILEEYEKQQYK